MPSLFDLALESMPVTELLSMISFLRFSIDCLFSYSLSLPQDTTILIFEDSFYSIPEHSTCKEIDWKTLSRFAFVLYPCCKMLVLEDLQGICHVSSAILYTQSSFDVSVCSIMIFLV